MFKKFMFFLLVMLMAINLIMPTCAFAKTTDNISSAGILRPYWTYLHTLYNWMDIDSSGKATMVSDMDTYSGTVNQVKMTNYLQRSINGTWTTVNSWTQTSSGTYGYWSNTYYVYTGYNYRLLTYYYAYNGSTLLESSSLISGTVYY